MESAAHEQPAVRWTTLRDGVDGFVIGWEAWVDGADPVTAVRAARSAAAELPMVPPAIVLVDADAMALADVPADELPGDGVHPTVTLCAGRLLDDPTRAFGALHVAEQRGWSVAICGLEDDLDAGPLVADLRPELLILDGAAVDRLDDDDRARVASTVLALAASGDTIVASRGATGPLLGGIGPRVAAASGPDDAVDRPQAPGSDAPTIPTPGQLTLGDRAAEAPRAALVELSRVIERRALAARSPAGSVAVAFQELDRISDSSRHVYEQMAEAMGWVGVVAEGATREPIRNAAMGDLPAQDPLSDEWAVAVITPGYSVVLVGEELETHDDDPDRMFRYGVFRDRLTALKAALSLAARVERV